MITIKITIIKHAVAILSIKNNNLGLFTSYFVRQLEILSTKKKIETTIKMF